MKTSSSHYSLSHFPLGLLLQKSNMGDTSVDVAVEEEVSFAPNITTTKPLSLFGEGITDIEIHFLQIKFTAIGVYIDPKIVDYLQKWKGKSAEELAQDDDFFEALVSAPVEKVVKVVLIKEIKGSQYGVQLESAVRSRLAEEDKYEEEEEEALEQVVQFFPSSYFYKNSVFTFYFSPTNPQIGLAANGKEEEKMEMKNANVAEMIQKWYLGGSRGVSPTTISSLAAGLAAHLSK